MKRNLKQENKRFRDDLISTELVPLVIAVVFAGVISIIGIGIYFYFN